MVPQPGMRVFLKENQLFADTITNKSIIWEMKEQTFLKEKTQSYEPKAHWCYGGRAAKSLNESYDG